MGGLALLTLFIAVACAPVAAAAFVGGAAADDAALPEKLLTDCRAA